MYYFLSKCGVDTAENGPFNVCKKREVRKNIGAGLVEGLAALRCVDFCERRDFYADKDTLSMNFGVNCTVGCRLYDEAFLAAGMHPFGVAEK